MLLTPRDVDHMSTFRSANVKSRHTYECNRERCWPPYLAMCLNKLHPQTRSQLSHQMHFLMREYFLLLLLFCLYWSIRLHLPPQLDWDVPFAPLRAILPPTEYQGYHPLAAFTASSDPEILTLSQAMSAPDHENFIADMLKGVRDNEACKHWQKIPL